jgi:predicted protein tyrosine phosphatase
MEKEVKLKAYLKNDDFIGITSREEFLLLHDNGLIPMDACVIAIHDPDIPHHHGDILGMYHESLSLRFWDVEEPIGKYVPLTDDQAKLIRKVIERNKDKQFFIHCMAGQSRSAGVACAVECIKHFNGDVYAYKTGYSAVKEHPRYSPNWTVFDKIMNKSD